jgi:hypothetical protein
LLALLVVIVAAVLDWVWLALPFALIAVAITLPGRTHLRRLVLSVPVFVAALAMLFTALAVVNVQTDPRWCVVAVTVISAALGVAAPSPTAAWADAVDGWSAASALAVTALANRSVFGWSAADVVADLGSHTDAVRHTTLGAAVNAYGGYVTFDNHANHLLPGLQHYPQGSAALMAAVIRACAGRHPTVGTTAVIGLCTLVAILAITAWLLTSIALIVAERVRPAPLRTRDRAAAFAVVVATGVTGPLLLTHQAGYFAQEVAIVGLLAAIRPVADQAAPRSRNHPRPQPTGSSGTHHRWRGGPGCPTPPRSFGDNRDARVLPGAAVRPARSGRRR